MLPKYLNTICNTSIPSILPKDMFQEMQAISI